MLKTSTVPRGALPIPAAEVVADEEQRERRENNRCADRRSPRATQHDRHDDRRQAVQEQVAALRTGEVEGVDGEAVGGEQVLTRVQRRREVAHLSLHRGWGPDKS